MYCGIFWCPYSSVILLPGEVKANGGVLCMVHSALGRTFKMPSCDLKALPVHEEQHGAHWSVLSACDASR